MMKNCFVFFLYITSSFFISSLDFYFPFLFGLFSSFSQVFFNSYSNISFIHSRSHFGFLPNFLIAILHRDLRNDFFFLQTITFSNLYLDCFSTFLLFGLLFPVLFRLSFLFWTFISFLDFYFFFGLLFHFLHKSRSDLGFLPSFYSHQEICLIACLYGSHTYPQT
jgi:hypothetical protein